MKSPHESLVRPPSLDPVTKERRRYERSEEAEKIIITKKIVPGNTIEVTMNNSHFTADTISGIFDGFYSNANQYIKRGIRVKHTGGTVEIRLRTIREIRKIS